MKEVNEKEKFKEYVELLDFIIEKGEGTLKDEIRHKLKMLREFLIEIKQREMGDSRTKTGAELHEEQYIEWLARHLKECQDKPREDDELPDINKLEKVQDYYPGDLDY